MKKKMDPYLVSRQKWELQYVATKTGQTIVSVLAAIKAVGRSRRKVYNWLRALPVLILLMGCSQGKPKEKFIPRADTCLTLGSYVHPQTLAIQNDVIFEVVRDGVTVDSVLTAKRVKDTAYYVFFGRKDSSGKNIYDPVPFMSVSTHHRLDTNIARLTRYIKLIKPDTTIKK